MNKIECHPDRKRCIYLDLGDDGNLHSDSSTQIDVSRMVRDPMAELEKEYNWQTSGDIGAEWPEIFKIFSMIFCALTAFIVLHIVISFFHDRVLKIRHQTAKQNENTRQCFGEAIDQNIIHEFTQNYLKLYDENEKVQNISTVYEQYRDMLIIEDVIEYVATTEESTM